MTTQFLYASVIAALFRRAKGRKDVTGYQQVNESINHGMSIQWNITLQGKGNKLFIACNDMNRFQNNYGHEKNLKEKRVYGV